MDQRLSYAALMRVARLEKLPPAAAIRAFFDEIIERSVDDEQRRGYRFPDDDPGDQLRDAGGAACATTVSRRLVLRFSRDPSTRASVSGPGELITHFRSINLNG